MKYLLEASDWQQIWLGLVTIKFSGVSTTQSHSQQKSDPSQVRIKVAGIDQPSFNSVDLGTSEEDK